RYGMDPADLFVCQILLEAAPLTILAVPSRIWRKPERMGRMLRAKRSLAGHGRSSVIVPQSAIVGDMTSLVAALKRCRSSSTSTCPCGELHDPVGCVAYLLAMGTALRTPPIGSLRT